nr:unnamed protein product [Callosobruchus chinensis]CAH7760924.1 unnamed protein product [Callosobruchus chinensis]
MPSRCCVPGM